MRFIGDYSAKADSKGRVFLPVAFRKAMEQAGEDRLIMRTDLFQHCLVLYPESLWNSMLDTMSSRLSKWNGKHQQIMRSFVAEAEIVELDNNGRFLISKRKQVYANIKQDVRFLAVDDHIEVWDKDSCDSALSDNDSLGMELQKAMSQEEN
jgi:MraZ protein